MTKVRIDPGACGLSTDVEVRKKGKKTYSVTISSDCEMVENLGKELPELKMTDAFKRITDNPVFVKGAACLQHAACPVTCGILKALEVEAGLNVKKAATIHFFDDEDDRDNRNREER